MQGSQKTPEQVETEKLERRMLAQISRLNRSFDLIEADDRIMVALSGGKDSWGMLHLLRKYKKKVPFDFELIAVNIDQGQPGFDDTGLRSYLQNHQYDFRLVAQDTYSVVLAKTPENKSTCSMCSRLRRGILYRVATDLGATKIALGHHRDDAIETVLMSMFYSGQIKSMPPKLCSDNGRHTIIRPLSHCAEADLARMSTLQAFPIIPCNLCGSQTGLKRQRIKALLAELEQENTILRQNLLAALGNVQPCHLHDPKIWEFSNGDPNSVPVDGADDSHLPVTGDEDEMAPLVTTLESGLGFPTDNQLVSASKLLRQV